MTVGQEEYEWEPDADEGDDDPEEDQLPCPSCGRMVFDDTDRCPHCGDWIMPVAASSRQRHAIWVVAAVLATLGILLWIIR